MDPNRFVERMIMYMDDATRAAREGNPAAALASWQEVADNLSDLTEGLNKGGFLPTLDISKA